MKEGGPEPAGTAADPARWLDEHGDYLYRFALGRVGRTDAAEDLVQETFLAALRGAAAFAGRSSERTWLTGILKNKLIDRLRRDGRSPTAGRSDVDLDGLFDATGHWKPAPGAWGGDPAALMEQDEFRQAVEDCRQSLPERLREVLSLRVFDDAPPAEICQALSITPTNLWTLLHRARLRLWQCLDRKGLAPKPNAKKS